MPVNIQGQSRGPHQYTKFQSFILVLLILA